MAKYLRLTSLIFVLSILTVTAQQQQQRSPWDKANEYLEWEFSFFLGASFLGDKSSATPIEDQDQYRLVQLDYTSGFSAGLRLTQNLGDRMGAELDYIYSNQPLTLLNLTPEIPRFAVDQGIHTFQYSILFYVFDRSSKIRPFGQVGGGAQLFYISGNSKNEALAQGFSLEETWKFAANFGGGVKFLVGTNWGFRFDVRDVISGTPSYGLPPNATENSPGFRPDGRLHNWQTNIGFFYTWDSF